MAHKSLSCLAGLSLFGALLITVLINHDACIDKQPTHLAYKCTL